jgi:hypothetical protein
MSTDQDALRELLGPAADVPAPPSPDDRDDDAAPTGGIIPGTGRRAEDHRPAPNHPASTDPASTDSASTDPASTDSAGDEDGG